MTLSLNYEVVSAPLLVKILLYSMNLLNNLLEYQLYQSGDGRRFQVYLKKNWKGEAGTIRAPSMSTKWFSVLKLDSQ